MPVVVVLVFPVGETVDANTDFAPLVVVPDAGVPNGLLTQFDIVMWGYKMFVHLQPHVFAPGIVPVSDIQLLEGMADLAPKIQQFSRQGRRHDDVDCRVALGSHEAG